MAKYRLIQTEPTVDGTEMIKFDLFGLSDLDEVLRHADILVPVTQVQTALASANPGPNLILALKANFPAEGWSEVELDEQAAELAAFNAANENTSSTDQALDAFIVSELGGYPVNFSA